MNYFNSLENLYQRAKSDLSDLVNKHGTEGDDYNEKVIEIPEDFQFNLDRGADYVKFVASKHFISNNGQIYDFESLSAEELFEMVDGLIEDYLEV